MTRTSTRSSPSRTRFEYLREVAHLRRADEHVRRGGAGAALPGAWRSTASSTSEGFYWVHTPIITASDAEGAGQMFRVSTLDLCEPAAEGGAGSRLTFRQDFFGKESAPHRERASSTSRRTAGALQCLHLRPDVPRGEQQHVAPPGRVLDDRAGDRLLRPPARRASSPKTCSSTLFKTVLERAGRRHEVLRRADREGRSSSGSST